MKRMEFLQRAAAMMMMSPLGLSGGTKTNPGGELTRVTIRGEEYLRIPYGEEFDDWGADRQPCHDCGVVKGQFHVPGCDVERCPRCGGQLIGANHSISGHSLYDCKKE